MACNVKVRGMKVKVKPAPEPHFNKQIIFTGIGISIIKIRQSSDFIMRIPILVRYKSVYMSIKNLNLSSYHNSLVAGLFYHGL